ncbi:13274_t:CDS:2 [Acaulospora morrowiae]|uniref:13274_t:CDS:1 n=1 Tax=Acaulospora morrowiae TaxID=94023 RepID=A0A9N8WFE2_9GLOM|nr:13274_t:CDS:2 [Acaulospora morrowiae]
MISLPNKTDIRQCKEINVNHLINQLLDRLFSTAMPNITVIRQYLPNN